MCVQFVAILIHVVSVACSVFTRTSVSPYVFLTNPQILLLLALNSLTGFFPRLNNLHLKIISVLFIEFQ